MSNSDFSLSSFEVWFENTVKVLRGQTNMEGEAKHGVWKSNVKTGKYYQGLPRGQFHVLFGLFFSEMEKYDTQRYLTHTVPNGHRESIGLTASGLIFDGLFPETYLRYLIKTLLMCVKYILKQFWWHSYLTWKLTLNIMFDFVNLICSPAVWFLTFYILHITGNFHHFCVDWSLFVHMYKQTNTQAPDQILLSESDKHCNHCKKIRKYLNAKSVRKEINYYYYYYWTFLIFDLLLNPQPAIELFLIPFAPITSQFSNHWYDALLRYMVSGMDSWGVLQNVIESTWLLIRNFQFKVAPWIGTVWIIQ